MRALSATELLEVWERGLAQSPAQRALALLDASGDGNGTPTRCSITRRDRELLALRERTFGPQLASTARCPACGEQLAFDLDAADLRAGVEDGAEAVLSVVCAGHEVRFRLPDSLDLAALDPARTVEANRRWLLRRCVLGASRDDQEVAADDLPADVVQAISERMAAADPDAGTELALTCPECLHGWRAPLDIVSFFWSEIHVWAHRLLREVHLLASAYGWREADVLAVSAHRRRLYLEMIEP